MINPHYSSRGGRGKYVTLIFTLKMRQLNIIIIIKKKMRQQMVIVAVTVK